MSNRRKPGPIAGMAFRHLFKKPATIEYPAPGASPKVEKNYRGRLIYDPANCIDCKLCERDCPTGAIKIINDGTKQERKMRAELDVGRCIFCCQCVDSCRKGCISFTQDVAVFSPTRARLKIDPSAAKRDHGA